jgi:bifunctional UDP-N-acetylglucosamine pyrophosphorylase / glucosamine-1-phosphate N-acetyltransferase
MNVPADETHTEPSPALRSDRVEALIETGVQIIDPERTYVEEGVRVAAGTVLFPGTYLRGSTIIKDSCQIGPDCWIEDSIIEQGCIVRYSYLEGAKVRERTTVGPYAHLRAGADVGPDARIGNFVEVKAARLERGVKAGHLAYIGDADVGEAVNIGAGTITCNYDGKTKHRTTIEDGAFVGSNSALVAPVTIGKGAYVAAGSTITEDVPAEAQAFGRARQVNKRRGREAGEEDADV